MSFICVECSKPGLTFEFPSLKQLDEHSKNGHPVPPWLEGKEKMTKVKAEPKKTSKGKKEGPPPLDLEYRWVGACPDCGSNEIDTLSVEMGDKEAKVAYCSNCRKQLKEQKVIPINKQKR